MQIPSFEKGDEMWGCGLKGESGDGSTLGFNLTPAPTSYQFIFLNVPFFLLEACDLWIYGGFRLTEMVLHTLHFLL